MKHTIPPRGTEVTEADELARLVPAPHAPELSDDRHDALRRFLVNEIDTSTRVPAPVRPRSRRLAVALSAGAGGIAAVFAAAVFTLGSHGTASGPAAGKASALPSVTQSGIVRVEPGSAAKTGAVLTQIAYVAASQQAPVPREDQFVYVKSAVAWTQESAAGKNAGRRVLDSLHEREIWLAQEKAAKRVDPSRIRPKVWRPDSKGPIYSFGILRERGETMPLYGPMPNEGPTYRQLAALPTDPDALLRKIYSSTEGRGDGPDAEAFNYIGDLLRESIAPPEVTAALYRAAAKIPGVIIVPDAVDAAGRHGFGVAHVSQGERYEWIFDSHTMQYLGEREYLVADTPGGKAGMLTGTTAVLTRGVADKAGEIPRPPARTPTVGM